MPKKATTEQISIPKIDVRELTIAVVGDSSLVCHKWSKKAKQQMLDKQMGRAKQAKEKKDPERDYRESLYVIEEDPDCFEDGVFGFPAVAFKSAAVDACSYVEGLTKVAARGTMHVVGDLVVINGRPNMREDMVRISMGTADIRYRGEFQQWSAVLKLRYNAGVLTAEQITNLFNVGGFSVGVGEGRPQKDQSWGMFHVASEEELGQVAA